MQFTLDKYTEIKEIKNSFDESLETIREELDQHLDTINQNTHETQNNYDYIEQLNSRMDKLEARLDKICMLLLDEERETTKEILQPKVSTKGPALTNQEKEVFKILYTTQEAMTHDEVAFRLNISQSLAEDIINTLIIKNIPIAKKTFANTILLLLDDDFREVQAKHNVVGLSSSNLISYC